MDSLAQMLEQIAKFGGAKVAHTVEEIGKLGGPKKAKLYEEIKAGRLKARKMGRATRIFLPDFIDYMRTLPLLDDQTCGFQRGGLRHESRARLLPARRTSPLRSPAAPRCDR